MEYGPSEERRIGGAIQRKRELPRSIRNAPELWPGLEIFLSAFWELNSSRSVGLAIGPIPYSEIVEWGRVWELDDEMLDDLIFHVRRMDAAYVEKKQPPTEE